MYHTKEFLERFINFILPTVLVSIVISVLFYKILSDPEKNSLLKDLETERANKTQQEYVLQKKSRDNALLIFNTYYFRVVDQKTHKIKSITVDQEQYHLAEKGDIVDGYGNLKEEK